MELSLDKFYQVNRRVLIWLLLLGLVWVLRGYFDIIFLVFVLCYLTMPVSKLLQKRLMLPHFLATTLVYLGVLAVGAGFFQFVTPSIVRETESIVTNAPRLEESAISFQRKLAQKYPYLSKLATNYLKEAIPDNIQEGYLTSAGLPEKVVPDEAVPRLYVEWTLVRIRDYMPHAMMLVWPAVGNLLISLLFAYLISLDTARLAAEVDSLKRSRLRDFHEQTAGPVVNFANTVGRALQAQFMIACVNTILTAIGLVWLGLPAITSLAVVVFLCSFIPVLGVFISTAPMILVSLGTGDFMMAIWVVALIVGIHTIEAYVLNPIIYGRHLRLNPVLVLIILYVGHRGFGVWGMLLGVPVAHYLMHDVFGIRAESEATKAPDGEECPP